MLVVNGRSELTTFSHSNIGHVSLRDRQIARRGLESSLTKGRRHEVTIAKRREQFARRYHRRATEIVPSWLTASISVSPIVEACL